jgi:RND family efflux transporter MFP subunit
MQEAIVEKLLDQKRKHTIITRFDGYVTAEYTEEGAWVNRGDPVAEVAALDEVDVVANVLESQISYIKKGDPIRVEIPALPRSERVVMGYIEAIVPQADVRARTIPVLIRVSNKISEEDDDPLIKAGMLARAMLSTGPETKALFVPKDAINLGGPTPTIYVVRQKSPKDDTGKAVPVSVRLGIAYGSLIEVEGELKAGDLVVVRGNERLTPMADVKITDRIDSRKLIETEQVSVEQETSADAPATE